MHADHPGGRLQKAGDGLQDGGLAATGRAEQNETFARRDPEGDVLDGTDRAFSRRIIQRQTVDLEDGSGDGIARQHDQLPFSACSVSKV